MTTGCLAKDEVEVRGTPTFVISPRGRGSYKFKLGTIEVNPCIIDYKNLETGKHFRALGDNLPDLQNTEVILRGCWKNNARYGEGFHVNSYEIKLPTSEKGVVEYLNSLRVRIGITRAKKIYAKFGENVWDILETAPERLMEVPGITNKIVERLKQKMEETKIDRELTKLFIGISDSITNRKLAELKQVFGVDAVSIITNAPYKLCQVRGFSFDLVDKLGKKLGVPANDPARIEAAITYLLDNAAGQGHTCLPTEELKAKLSRLLRVDQEPSQAVTDSDITTALRNAWANEAVKTTSNMVYTKSRYDQEVSVAQNVVRLLNNNADGIEDIETFIVAFEKEKEIALADNQKDAVRNAFKHKMSIITGGPGTGKTTIINAILFVHQKIYGNVSEPVFMSPTGKAARRMTETTGFPASTIHAAVGYRGEGVEIDDSNDGEEGMLSGNLFIVDEFSMADLFISSVLLRKIPDSARLICVGDPDQLPSVGCGNVLYEMIRSGKIPTTKLNVIFRQKDTSAIVTNAAKIREGETDLIFNDQFCLIRKGSTNEVFEQAINRYCECVQKHGIDNVVLLCPYRNKGIAQVNRFNLELQKRLNPVQPEEPVMRGENGVMFHKGDKIIQKRNTEIARNGDTGYIKRIEVNPDPDDPSDNILSAIVEFNGDGIEHNYAQSNLQELDLAYCTTVHKSQGSEYKVVIIVLSMEHKMLLKRNIVYTGITRAKEYVLIITEREGAVDYDGSHSQESPLNKAIINGKADIRYSLLGDRIVAYTSKH